MGSRRRIAAGALVAVAVAIVAIVLLDGGGGAGPARAGGLPAGDTTATVTRRTLTESTTVDGTLGYGSTLELYDRLAGTFTWLPSVGTTVARGGTLFRVNNEPVVLMYGSVPAYRTLKEGVSDGPDVAELNANLIDLGYYPAGAADEGSHFGEATATAVRRWQKSEGLTQTGEVELGRVVFAPSARRVTAVHVQLGQDPPGGSEGSPSSPSSGQPSSEAPGAKGSPSSPGANDGQPSSGKPSSGQPSSGKPSSGEPTKGEPSNGKPSSGKPLSGEPLSGEPSHSGSPDQAGKPKPQGSGAPAHDNSDTEHGKESPGSGGSDPSKSEGAAGAGTAVLTTTSTQQLVQLKLKAEQQQLARIGERAPVTLPGGEVVPGRIIEVGTVASEGKGDEGEKSPGGSGNGNGGSPGNEGSGESATIPVTLVLTRPAPHLDEAPVSVDLVKSVQRNVLAVPATSLIATGGGNYAIVVLEGSHRVQLPVTPGMFANGYVQVEGSGLHEGQTVLESE